jgi:RNA polymerase sigma factor (sigma-70 family)
MEMHEKVAPHVDLDSITVWAVRGLSIAMADFRTRQGASFRNYLAYRIRSEIYNELSSTKWASDEFRRQYMFAKKSNELLLQFSLSAEGTMKRTLKAEEEEMVHLLSLLAVVALLVWRKLHQPEINHYLQQTIGALNDRQKLFLNRYYDQDAALDTISKELGFSTSAAFRFHLKILEKIASEFAGKFS